MKQGSFEEIWKQVEKLHILPSQAIDHVPSVLSDSSKRQLSMKSPSEVASLVSSAIDEINHGSTELLDELVRNRLKRGASYAEKMGRTP